MTHHKDPETETGVVKLPSKMKITSEWIWRSVCFLMLAAGLYLKGNYVSADTYAKDQRDINEQIKNLNLLVSNMEVRNEINTRQDAELADHEARIRVLEAKTFTRSPSPKTTNQ